MELGSWASYDMVLRYVLSRKCLIRMVARDGIEPPTRGFSAGLGRFEKIKLNQPLAAFANLRCVISLISQRSSLRHSQTCGNRRHVSEIDPLVTLVGRWSVALPKLSKTKAEDGRASVSPPAAQGGSVDMERGWRCVKAMDALKSH